MDSEYVRIFRNLYTRYRRPIQRSSDGRGSVLPIEIGDAIEEIVGELGLGKIIRPDAKHFLLVNLHQMVVLPYVQRQRGMGQSQSSALAELRDSIREDVRTILSGAMERRVTEEELSGHDIVKSLVESWSRLRCSRFEIWG